VSGLSPLTRAARRIRRIDAIVLVSRVFSRRRVCKMARTCKGTRARHDGRRSGSCNCIAFTGDAEAGPRHEGRDKHSFLPNWSSPRRCLQMQKNVRGGIEFFDIGSSSPQGAMGRRFERTASTQVHRSWRTRIAAPRLARKIRSARTVSGLERSSPLL
jgi:hypothetical protein